MANDEEYAEQVAKAISESQQQGGEKASVPLHTWTPEVAALTDLRDAVMWVRHAVLQAAGAKGLKTPEPALRPQTPLQRARERGEFKRRQTKHEALAARLLPHKRPGYKPPPPPPALPEGWKRDAAGRLRDARGRYVKEAE